VLKSKKFLHFSHIVYLCVSKKTAFIYLNIINCWYLRSEWLAEN